MQDLITPLRTLRDLNHKLFISRIFRLKFLDRGAPGSLKAQQVGLRRRGRCTAGQGLDKEPVAGPEPPLFSDRPLTLTPNATLCV